jgi:hypothetical protein
MRASYSTFVRVALIPIAFVCARAPSVAAASRPSSHVGIEKVVFEGTKATFVHRLSIGPGEEVRIATNVADVDGDLEVTRVEPADELQVFKPGAVPLSGAGQRFSEILKSGIGGDFDFDVGAFRKWLLGQEVTVHVAENEVTTSIEGSLKTGGSDPVELDGQVASLCSSRYAVKGELLGFGKDGGGKETLKILSKQRGLLEISQETVRSIDFGAVPGDDLRSALEALRKKREAGPWALTVRRVPGTGSAGGGLGSNEELPVIVYSHPVTNSWKIQYRGELGSLQYELATTLLMSAWAKITNETPYPWRDVAVILKAPKADYYVENVTLGSGETRSFPVLFGLNAGSSKDEAPIDKVKLTATRERAIIVPDGEPTTNRGLSCLDTLKLQNGGLYALPAGLLTVCHGEDRLGSAEFPELAIGSKPVRVTLGTLKGLVALYTRPKSESFVRLDRIDGHVLTARRGYELKYRFRCDDALCESVGVADQVVTISCPMSSACSCGGAKKVHLVYYKAPTGSSFSIPELSSDKKTVTVREVGQSETWNIADLSSNELKALKGLPLADSMAPAISSMLSIRGSIQGLQLREAEYVRQIEAVEKRMEAYVGNVYSLRREPALRRLLSLRQEHQRLLAATRDELAVAEFEFDHLVQGLRVPDRSR